MLALSALGMGTVIVLATFSRGALAMMVMGYALVTLLSTWDQPRPHKFKTVGLMFLAALPLIIKVTPAIIERFETAPVSAEASIPTVGTARSTRATKRSWRIFGS